MADRRLIYQDLKTIRYIHVRVPDQSGDDLSALRKSTTQTVGREVLTYKVEIDVGSDLLDSMAVKAAGNNRKQCRRGPLIVTITGRRAIEDNS